MSTTVSKKKIAIVSILGLVVIALLAIYYNHNPSGNMSFLQCPVKLATGYHCAGCGSQRAIHQMLHLNFYAAFRMNPFFMVAFPLILWSLTTKILNYLLGTEYRVHLFYNKIFVYGFFGFAILYWIVRNLPYEPFSWLAPTEV